jgi:hypothetical protein
MSRVRSTAEKNPLMIIPLFHCPWESSDFTSLRTQLLLTRPGTVSIRGPPMEIPLQAPEIAGVT